MLTADLDIAGAYLRHNLFNSSDALHSCQNVPQQELKHDCVLRLASWRTVHG
jgi:hypothetical protein